MFTCTTHTTHEQKEANPLFPYMREVQAVQNDVGHVFRLYNMQNNHVWVQKVRSQTPFVTCAFKAAASHSSLLAQRTALNVAVGASSAQEVDSRVLGLPEGKSVVKIEPFLLPEPEYTDIF